MPDRARVRDDGRSRLWTGNYRHPARADASRRPAKVVNAKKIFLPAFSVHKNQRGLVATERREGFSNVTAGLAILAGIAASDAICCVRLGRYHRGDDHPGATELLQTATPDGPDLATRLDRLLGLKDTAHYGATLVAPPNANLAMRWARQLVTRAQEELER